jgi:hypothetical protein
MSPPEESPSDGEESLSVEPHVMEPFSEPVSAFAEHTTHERSAGIAKAFLTSGLVISFGLAVVQQYCNGLPAYLAALFAVIGGSVSAGLVASSRQAMRD